MSNLNIDRQLTIEVEEELVVNRKIGDSRYIAVIDGKLVSVDEITKDNVELSNEDIRKIERKNSLKYIGKHFMYGKYGRICTGSKKYYMFTKEPKVYKKVPYRKVVISDITQPDYLKFSQKNGRIARRRGW